MARPRFYIGAPTFKVPEDSRNTGVFRHCDFPYPIELPEAAASHLRVLRLGVDDPIVLFDGAGGEFCAEVTSVGKKNVSVSVLSHDAVERESNVRVTVVQALAVGDKMDWIVQKACELGATAIVPVQSERCTLRLSGERADKRAVHWQQVAVAASEQCGRNRVARVEQISDFSCWAEPITPENAAYFMLHPEDDSVTFVSALRALLDSKASAGASSLVTPIYILIGPEGGFSANEVQMAQAAGVILVRLGPRVLRTETAAAAALAIIGAVIGDLQ